ncbi:hypothetical protein RRG08_016834 [Elysia crispata]|uniref:Uncharacterized protein n=1 Tax=Elysia crispata TaxID=231223 RepID=A0AAE1DBY3_9GAST|nr:hypothetical protein RRG08_016834 [Elysia crispata]
MAALLKPTQIDSKSYKFDRKSGLKNDTYAHVTGSTNRLMVSVASPPETGRERSVLWPAVLGSYRSVTRNQHVGGGGRAALCSPPERIICVSPLSPHVQSASLMKLTATSSTPVEPGWTQVGLRLDGAVIVEPLDTGVSACT